MPGLSRKIKSDGATKRQRDERSTRTFVLKVRCRKFAVAPLCLCALASGCSSAGTIAGRSWQPRTYQSADGALIVTVHGPLDRKTGTVTSSSRLETFLYGPPEPAQRIARTLQGLTYHDGAIYAADQGQPDVLRINLVDRGASNQTQWRDRPACPVSVAWDDAGRIYVADTTRRAVLVYDGAGRQTATLRPPEPSLVESDTSGQATDGFTPTAVRVHEGILYVADRVQRRIERYDVRRGEWLAWWPVLTEADVQNAGSRGNPPPGRATGLAVPAGLALTHDGTLLVADALLGVVHRIDAHGRLQAPIGKRGRGPGELVRPIGVAAANNLVLVVDAAKQCLVVFDAGGRFLLEVPSVKDDWASWTLPTGITALPNDFPGMPAACTLEGRNSAESNDRAQTAAGDEATWFVVADTLGAPELTLLCAQFSTRAEHHAPGGER